jgi:hypothetical protein
MRTKRRANRAGMLSAMLALGLAGMVASPGSGAQTVTDEFMLTKRQVQTSLSYSHDAWDEYWEGSLKRDNGNIGTLTSETATWGIGYGLHDRFNVLASVPYVWTHASQGVLHDMEGFQDFTLAAKVSLLDAAFENAGAMRIMAVFAGTTPLSNYTPDFMPLSIGTASDRFATRLTLTYRSQPGWFVNASASYTWRGKVELDRPYYFTDDRLFLTNEVEMPDVFDYYIGAGYAWRSVMGSLVLSEQRTQGGGDIRRQDMPFVSNRVNFSRVAAMLTYAIPRLRGLELRLSHSYVTEGRNVGQSSAWTTDLMYRFGSEER